MIKAKVVGITNLNKASLQHPIKKIAASSDAAIFLDTIFKALPSG